MARDSLFIQEDETEAPLPFEEVSDSEFEPAHRIPSPAKHFPARKDFVKTRPSDYEPRIGKYALLALNKKKTEAAKVVSRADIQGASRLMSTAMLRQKPQTPMRKASLSEQDVLSEDVPQVPAEAMSIHRVRKRYRTDSLEPEDTPKPQRRPSKKQRIDHAEVQEDHAEAKAISKAGAILFSFFEGSEDEDMGEREESAKELRKMAKMKKGLVNDRHHSVREAEEERTLEAEEMR